MDVVPPLSMLSAANSGAVTGLTVALIILVIFSAFLSASETAYSFANKIRLKTLEAAGSKRATMVLKQLDKFDSFLNTVLIGNNIVNLTAASLSTILFAKILSAESQAFTTLISTAVITIAILLFGEILPKSLAKEYPEKIAMAFVPLISLLIIILLPIAWVFSLWRKIIKPKHNAAVKEEELITIVEEAENEGEIDKNESRLIRSAIEFDDVEVEDIMVPRVNMIAVRDDLPTNEIMETFVNHGFSRLPVYHETIDAIIGIIHEKDFYMVLRNNKGIKDIIKSSICMSGNMKISDALRTLQKAKAHMAIVVDEFGGTSGIVTMEDILEELVGEIYDEHDEVEVLFKKEEDGSFTVSGEENLDDMFEGLGITPKEEYYSTSVGGWVTEIMKKIPVAGESFLHNNLEATVTKADARRVVEINIKFITESQDN